MPAADFRDGVFPSQTFQDNADLFLCGELTSCGFSDLFDDIGGHGGSFRKCAMTSFGRVDGDCQARVH